MDKISIRRDAMIDSDPSPVHFITVASGSHYHVHKLIHARAAAQGDHVVKSDGGILFPTSEHSTSPALQAGCSPEPPRPRDKDSALMACRAARET